MTLTLTLKTDFHILSKLSRLENQSFSIVKRVVLKPLPFTLATLQPCGYVIYFNHHIIEYDVTHDLVLSSDNVYYYGPTQLFIKQADEMMPVPSLESDGTYLQSDLNWKGIDSNRFYAYRKWINQDATCGMYSAAVLLAYYKDYIDDNIVPDSLHPYRTNIGDKLIMAMKVYIKSLSFRGTIAYDLSMGINSYLRDYKVAQKVGYTIKAKANLATTLGIVKTRLDSNIAKPVIVGLYSWLGSPQNYKNHWVVAYSYADDGTDTYYRVHDNHGRYRAVINVKWTIGTVRLIRRPD